MKRSFVYMSDLNNILFFARIVEHGSLTAAAESLGVAKSMLSQRLSGLEQELGVQLCRDALDDARLVRLLPEWTLREQRLYVTYPSKQGLTLAARTLVDFVSRHLRNGLRHVQDGTFQFSISQSRQRAIL